MNIKSLELIGFKSFYNKSLIEFHNGINGVVGPNGCGKSNIIDAIRWVLGEQNSRLLRADGSMEELISNGSENVKPLGMAQVTMVVENVPDSGFDEISIQRRLYRSGESEYYISGVRCRLKDIREMFLDTGVGSRAYSIIGQGKVEEFITAKPEDKRQLIEEVAGIVKYKTRRKETLNRLETTKENLSRILDMKSEVSRQMNNLSRQAENAEKYREMSDEARVLELKILFSKEKDLNTKITEMSGKKSELANEISRYLNIRKQKSGIADKHESQNTTLEQKISAIEDELFRLKSDLNNKSSFRNYANKEIANIDIYVEKLANEIESLRKDKEGIFNIIEIKKSDHKNIEEDISFLESKIQNKNEQLQQVKNEVFENRQTLQNTRKDLFDTINKHSNARESLFALNKELEELSLRKERTCEEKNELEEENSSLSQQKKDLENKIEHIRSNKKVLDDKADTEKNKLSETRTKFENEYNELSELKEDFSQYKSRIEALRQIQSNYEWLPETTRDFLMKSKGNGILGVITDFISAPKNYEKALEAALAEKLNWVVVTESNEAVKAVETLRQSSMGRGTFIPLSCTHNSRKFSKNGTNTSMINELVEVEGIDKEIVDSILNGIFVATDLNEAFELQKHLSNEASFVTLDGDHLDSTGAISGGFTSGGVFERKTEISELESSLDKCKSNISQLSSKSEETKNVISEYETRLEEIEKDSRSRDIELIELNKDLSNLVQSLNRNTNRINYLDEEIKRISHQIEEKNNSSESFQSKASELEKKKDHLNSKCSEYENMITEIERKENELENELSSLKIDNASVIEKKRSVEYEIKDQENRGAKIEDKINSEWEEIESKKKEKFELHNSIEDTGSEITGINKSIEEKQNLLTQIREQKENEREELKKNRSEVTQLDETIGNLREKNSQLEVKLNSLRMEYQYVIEQKEKISEESNIERKEKSEIEEDFDIKNAEEKLSSLKKKIERFGPVNLLAPEEYKNLEERHTFLQEQTDDLENAMASLKKAVNKLDRESVTRFEEAFEIINKKFREILSRLFTGGEGKLVIIDPEDILQTGIEVMVKPRGKRYQSINLLSGGEKALSAIALIISACFVKPVPFMILDEIDAPLDEANTARFTELVKEIANESQVIVITHNKVTMQTVDNLIGVTSDRSVTSKIVSVDMHAHS